MKQSGKQEVFCTIFKQTLTQLPQPPFVGELGDQIRQRISKQAWHIWLQEQTRFINEHRLNFDDEADVKVAVEVMKHFLFGDTTDANEGERAKE